MADIKLYRRFYCVSFLNGSQTYTLIDPVELSVSTFLAGSGSTIGTTPIETSISYTHESLGFFFANLNPTLYSFDNSYDLVWSAKYTNVTGCPTKLLPTRFRLNPLSVGSSIQVEILKAPINVYI